MKKLISFLIFGLIFSSIAGQSVKITQLHIFRSPANPIIKDSDICIINKHDSIGSAQTVDSATGTIYFKDIKAYANSGTSFADTNKVGVQYVVPTTGNTVVSNGAQTLICNPSGTLSALTIDFPSTAQTGQTFNLIITQAIGTLSLTGGAGINIEGSFPSSSTNGKGGWVLYGTTWFWR